MNSRAHLNDALELGGVIVNRVDRTVEHGAGLEEIERCFLRERVSQPHVPKRTVLQDATRQGVPQHELGGPAAQELGDASGKLAGRVEVARVAA